MTKLVYNDNNTEGAHQTSFDFIDTEIKKDDKIVATDLTDLYDVEITDVQDGEVLTYDDNIDKWVNSFVEGGGGCDVISEDTTITIGSGGDFYNLKDCFDYLRDNCKVIEEDVVLTISLLSNIYIGGIVSLNHPYGHRIEINGNGYEIVRSIIIEYSSLTLTYYYKPQTLSFSEYVTSFVDIDGTIKNFGASARRLYPASGNPEDRKASGDDVDWHFVTGSNDKILAIKTDGSMWGWGFNVKHELGIIDGINKIEYTQETTLLGNWEFVSIGERNSLAIDKDGNIYGTGLNLYGELGLGHNNETFEFTRIGFETNWVHVDMYESHSSFLNDIGQLYLCGSNSKGQLGLGVTGGLYHDLMMVNDGNGSWNSISTGSDFTVGIRTNGTLWGVGYNNVGQLGLGDKIDRNEFTLISNDTDWIEVSCGEYHTIALKSDGTLWGTGSNIFGQIAYPNGDGEVRDVLSQIESDVKHIQAGRYHSAIVKNDDMLYTSGANRSDYYGEIELGPNRIRTNYFKRPYTFYKEYFYDKSDYYDDNNALYNHLKIDNSHSIKKMYNIIFYSHIMTGSASETKYDPVQPISTFIMKIMNNSNISLDNIDSRFSEYISIPDMYYEYPAILKLSNNSYAKLSNMSEDTNKMYIFNNSTIELDTETEIEYIAKNGSTVLTNDVTMFNNSTFINSKLIEL